MAGKQCFPIKSIIDTLFTHAVIDSYQFFDAQCGYKSSKKFLDANNMVMKTKDLI